MNKDAQNTPQQQDANEIQALFSRVRAENLEPSPYMKTRIAARLREIQSEKKSVFVWKWLAAGSLSAVMFMGWFSFSVYQKSLQDGVANQAYVIHVDFSQKDLENIANAEVILPKDVHFVSSNRKVVVEKSLKLPVDVKVAGPGKLPFVVSSTSPGEKEITVRLLNDKDEVVREKVLKFKFAAQQDSRAAL